MSEEALTGQEILGVISGRVVHSLTNYLSALSGNLMVAMIPGGTEEQTSAALAGVKEAARRSAELLDQFSELTRSLPKKTGRCSVEDAIGNLRGSWKNWEIRAAPPLTVSKLCFAGPWKWIQFCLGAVADPEEGAVGTIIMETTKNTRTVRPMLDFITKEYLSIDLLTPHALPIQWEEHRSSLREWKRMAAYELFAQMGGRPETFPLPTGLQRTTITLPLAER